VAAWKRSTGQKAVCWLRCAFRWRHRSRTNWSLSKPRPKLETAA